MTGHVAIVGAGPGDPELATLAAVRALRGSDVVFYDALSPAELLDFAPAEAERIYVGKRAASHAMSQPEIEARLIAAAKEGKRVVRLKGGDPFVFGRGGEEALACRAAGVPFTVVPGITSAIAAPAAAGIPVTHRTRAASFLVVTGSPSDEGGAAVDWTWAARAETLVILMGASTIDTIVEQLVAAGRDALTPAAFVRWGTRPDQQVVTSTLGALPGAVREAGLSAPAVIVVGSVAELANQLEPGAQGRLARKRVVVTRARSQASQLRELLRAEGARVVEAPVLDIRAIPGDWAAGLIAGRPAWLVLTSANAMDAFIASIRSCRGDVRNLAGLRLAAVGEATTASLVQYGLTADFVPSRATSAALCTELPVEAGEVVAYPASNIADEALERGLAARGARVLRATAYATTARPLDGQQLRDVMDADAITFTSASTARFLADALGESAPATTRLVSIGPQTSAAVRAAFGRVDAEADTPALESLVEAVCQVLAP